MISGRRTTRLDLGTWLREPWGSEAHRVVVSTVLIGTRPPLWETAVFGGEFDGRQERYDSLAAAMHGHERVLALVRGHA